MPPAKPIRHTFNADHSWSDLQHSVKVTIPKHLGNARHAILKIRAMRRSL